MNFSLNCEDGLPVSGLHFGEKLYFAEKVSHFLRGGSVRLSGEARPIIKGPDQKASNVQGGL
jgi:hypothetical protein